MLLVLPPSPRRYRPPRRQPALAASNMPACAAQSNVTGAGWRVAPRPPPHWARSAATIRSLAADPRSRSVRVDRRWPHSSAVRPSDSNASATSARPAWRCARYWLVTEPVPGYAPELNPVELHVDAANAFSSVQTTFSPSPPLTPPQHPPTDELAITLDRQPPALPSTRNRPRTAVQGCVLRPLCAATHGRRDDRRLVPTSVSAAQSRCSGPGWT